MSNHERIPYRLETLDLMIYRDPAKVPTFSPGKLNGPRYDIDIATQEVPAEKKDYITFTYPRAQDPALNLFLKAFVEAMAFWKIIDVYAPNPTSAFDKLIDDFLMQHAGMNYDRFKREAHAYEMKEDDFGKVAKKGLRGKLFGYRSQLYLSALAAVTSKGVALEQILDQVHDAIIPPIKKEKNEPTFEYIYKVLSDAHSE